MKNKSIKVIDLFSGPGGLGEGFSSPDPVTGEKSPFKIAISIEKEPSAHATLTLRAFYRQFPHGKAPKEYYDFLKGNLGKTPEEKLYKYPKFSEQVKAAKEEARCLTLGEDNKAIYKAIDKAIDGDKCIVIGGPPCQAYSLVGRARRNGEPGYVAEDDHRNFLYKEYLKILGRYKPVAFVMENVKGMLSAEVGGIGLFDQICRDLHDPCKFIGEEGEKYKVFPLVVPPMDSLEPSDFIIRAEEFGIPQARHRVILLGIQEQYSHFYNKNMLLRKKKGATLSSIIGGLPRLRSGLSKDEDSFGNWSTHISKIGSNVIKQVKRQSYQDIEKDLLVEKIENGITQLYRTPDSRGGNFSPESVPKSIYKGMPPELVDWYKDPAENIVVCNHETRGHIADDLGRYLFASSWAAAATEKGWQRPFPKPDDYPQALWPKHKNFHSGIFADRFRVQVRDRYATTVTSHISKDGHYFIHYDPSQCRSLTVREAARIQTFPDNYFFLGNRTQQYVQVGNAVPPLLASKIALIVKDLIVPDFTK